MYKIGDKVWIATFERVKKSRVCPDCCGKKKVKVVLGDDTEYNIDCPNCGGGYNLPTGLEYFYEHEAKTQISIIKSVRIEENYIEYLLENYLLKSERVFDNKEDAYKKALELKEEYDKYEIEQLNKKHKDHKSWAWHVTYYRGKIRDYEKDIEYYKKKLGIAIEKENI